MRGMNWTAQLHRLLNFWKVLFHASNGPASNPNNGNRIVYFSCLYLTDLEGAVCRAGIFSSTARANEGPQVKVNQ